MVVPGLSWHPFAPLLPLQQLLPVLSLQHDFVSPPHFALSLLVQLVLQLSMLLPLHEAEVVVLVSFEGAVVAAFCE